MATEKQFAANRANAQNSTGPVTEQGKANSSQNAARHSLTSKYLIILPGQEADFTALESGLRDRLRPYGPLEEVVFKRIVECSWNLERCRMAEFTHHQQTLLPDSEPLNVSASEAQIARFHRYAREFENSLYKAMRELSKLQAEIQFRDEVFPLTPEQEADPAYVARTPHRLSQLCPLPKVMKNVIVHRKHRHPFANALKEYPQFLKRIEEEQRIAVEIARAQAETQQQTKTPPRKAAA